MENSNIGDSKEAILLLLLIKVRVEKQSGIIIFFFISSNMQQHFFNVLRFIGLTVILGMHRSESSDIHNRYGLQYSLAGSGMFNIKTHSKAPEMFLCTMFHTSSEAFDSVQDRCSCRVRLGLLPQSQHCKTLTEIIQYSHYYRLLDLQIKVCGSAQSDLSCRSLLLSGHPPLLFCGTRIGIWSFALIYSHSLSFKTK